MWRRFGHMQGHRHVYSWSSPLSKGSLVLARTVRLVALALPVLLAVVLVSTGGWRVHHGQVERVGQSATSAAPALVPTGSTAAPIDQMTLVHHLSPSVPWPVWAGLIVLCLLPAVASMLAWSGSRRGSKKLFAAS
jgi:hypothetical protein